MSKDKENVGGAGGSSTLGTTSYGKMEYDIATEPFIGRDVEVDGYDRMPIDQFGKNVLSKLGW